MPLHIYFSFLLVVGINKKLEILCPCYMVVEWFGPNLVVVVEKVTMMGPVVS
jgi:hypothetical protein